MKMGMSGGKRSKRERRVRVTVTLPADIVRRIDGVCKKVSISRSEILTQEIREAERARAQAALREEIREYYRTRTAKEKAEDEAMSRAASRLSIEAMKADPDMANDEW